MRKIRLRIMVGSVCILTGFVVVLGYQSKAVADKLFGNMTYRTTCPYITENVTLINGERVVWNGRLHVSLLYKGRFVYGDFNRDGLKDAAVVISEGEGGTGHFRALAFLIHDGRQLVHRASYGLGDRARINSLTVRDHHVIVDAYVHGPHDCMAWPTKRVRNVYDYLQPARSPLSQTILSPGRDSPP